MRVRPPSAAAVAHCCEWRPGGQCGGALPHNPVLADRHAHLTGRADNPLTDAQARLAVAGSLLRQLFVVVTTATAWNPDIARGLTHPRIEVSAIAA